MIFDFRCIRRRLCLRTQANHPALVRRSGPETVAYNTARFSALQGVHEGWSDEILRTARGAQANNARRPPLSRPLFTPEVSVRHLTWQLISLYILACFRTRNAVVVPPSIPTPQTPPVCEMFEMSEIIIGTCNFNDTVK